MNLKNCPFLTIIVAFQSHQQQEFYNYQSDNFKFKNDINFFYVEISAIKKKDVELIKCHLKTSDTCTY